MTSNVSVHPLTHDKTTEITISKNVKLNSMLAPPGKINSSVSENIPISKKLMIKNTSKMEALI